MAAAGRGRKKPLSKAALATRQKRKELAMRAKAFRERARVLSQSKWWAGREWLFRSSAQPAGFAVTFSTSQVAGDAPPEALGVLLRLAMAHAVLSKPRRWACGWEPAVTDFDTFARVVWVRGVQALAAVVGAEGGGTVDVDVAAVEMWRLPDDLVVDVDTDLVADCSAESEKFRAVLALGLFEVLSICEAAWPGAGEDAPPRRAPMTTTELRVYVLNHVCDAFLRARAAVPCMVFPFVMATPLDALVALVLPSPEQRAVVRRCQGGQALFSLNREGRIAFVADRASRVYNLQPKTRTAFMRTSSSIYLAYQHLQYSIRKRRLNAKLRTLPKRLVRQKLVRARKRKPR